MMKLVYSASRPKARTLDDEAMGWVVKLTSGETSTEDHDAFRRWRAQSTAHDAALLRARCLWQTLGVALPAIEREQARRRGRAKRLLHAVPLAASLVAAVGFGHQYWTVGQFDHVTVAGERRTITLPDGSRMMMSGDTALNLSMDAGVRRIQLARGQIWVRVRPDAARPFVVRAGDSRFRDISTAFDVARTDHGDRLVVTDGAVEASRDDRRVLVRQDQAVVVSGKVGRVHAVNASAEVAWTRGRLILKNKTLPQILAEVAPHYRGRIVLLRRQSADRPLDATIDLAHIDEWLTALQQVEGVRAGRVGSLVFLM